MTENRAARRRRERPAPAETEHRRARRWWEHPLIWFLAVPLALWAAIALIAVATYGWLTP